MFCLLVIYKNRINFCILTVCLNSLHLFSAVTSNHKFSGLKQHRFIILQSIVPKLNGSQAKIKVLVFPVFLSGTSREESVSLPFTSSWGFPPPLIWRSPSPSVYTVVSFVNVNVLASFQSSCTVCLLFLLCCFGFNFQCTSYGSSESGHLCSVPDLKGKAF